MEQNTTIEAAAYTAEGTARERVTLPAELFDGTVNLPVMHQVVKAYLANQRQSNAHTKNRRMVTGGNQKPWKQKGTGRARQGSTRAPHWVGGGTVFGPTNERNYEQKVPRKVRQLGRKSALNARAREGALIVIDAFTMDAPKTAAVRALLTKLDVAERKVLILTDGLKPNVHLSARNLSNVHAMPYGDASTYHILWSDVVLVESGALGQPLAAEPAEAAAPAKTPRKRAARKTAAAGETSGDTTAETPAAPAQPATEE
jgi:large subunit ribosomal protein L4